MILIFFFAFFSFFTLLNRCIQEFRLSQFKYSDDRAKVNTMNEPLISRQIVYIKCQLNFLIIEDIICANWLDQSSYIYVQTNVFPLYYQTVHFQLKVTFETDMDMYKLILLTQTIGSQLFKLFVPVIDSFSSYSSGHS